MKTMISGKDGHVLMRSASGELEWRKFRHHMSHSEKWFLIGVALLSTALFFAGAILVLLT